MNNLVQVADSSLEPLLSMGEQMAANIAAKKDEQTWGEVLRKLAAERRIFLMFSLAFCIGWADVLCSIRYFAFATMMTGNSIYLAQSVAGQCWYDCVVYILVIFTFFSGMVTYRALETLICIYLPHSRMGPATALGALVFVCFTVADVTYYTVDNINRFDVDFQCGKKVKTGFFGILLVAHPMGAINGFSARVHKVTTNAVTGHILTLGSGTYDLLTARISGLPFTTDDKKTLLISLGVTWSLLLGIASGSAVDEELDMSKINGHLRILKPAWTTLGLVVAVVLWLHDYFQLGGWTPKPHDIHEDEDTTTSKYEPGMMGGE